MIKGVALGIGAGLLWGLAFVLPGLAPGWSAVTITTGRYLVYGVVSVVVLLAIARRHSGAFGAVRRHWRTALTFAATGNVAYYLLLVTSVQVVGAPIATVIIGSTPVVLAAASNVRQRSYAWRLLVLPLILVGVGLTTVSAPELVGSPSTSATSVIIGVAAALGAVAVWTLYGVTNAEFLTRHPEVGGSTWAAVVGIFTGGLAVILIPVALLLGPRTGVGAPPSTADVGLLIGVSVVLGLAVSWGGTWLWNETSSRLPTTLAGLLITVETISGYIYAYILEARLPAPLELVGFALVITGVVMVSRLRPNRDPFGPVGAEEPPADR